MPQASSPAHLEESIRLARASAGSLAGLPQPDVLFLCATGVGVLPEQLNGPVSVPLRTLEGVPAGWSDTVLHGGRLGDLSVWMLDDEGSRLGGEPAWSGGFPVWLAAASGAAILVHTSAGCALPGTDLGPSLLVASDHLRFGDLTPLTGLGPTDLGPLFPDLSLLHDGELRAAALREASGLGFDLNVGVVACTRGPALETPAEQALLQSLGASVSVQSLAAPLLAAGHAGLRALALVAVTDGGDRPVDLAALLTNAETLAPKLDDLLIAMSPHLEQRVSAIRKESTL